MPELIKKFCACGRYLGEMQPEFLAAHPEPKCFRCAGVTAKGPHRAEVLAETRQELLEPVTKWLPGWLRVRWSR